MVYNCNFLYVVQWEKARNLPHCREAMLDGFSTQIWHLGGMTEEKDPFGIGTHCKRCLWDFQ